MENLTLNKKLDQGFVYRAQLVIEQKKAFLKIKGNRIDVEKDLANLNFKDGSRLFTEAMKVINPKGFTPNPDDPGGPIPDPFGILAGLKPIPWQLGPWNPRAEGSIRCFECPFEYNVTTGTLTLGRCHEVPC